MLFRVFRSRSLLFMAMWFGLSAAAFAQGNPSPKLALSFKPVQTDVVYEIPKADEVEKCTVKVEQTGKGSGWVVYGPANQVLRRFSDTNGDGVVDQWRYYNHGIEVYRDFDSNFNKKVDQSRWLHTGGTRWGVDRNEDGKVDQWNVISAQEVTREAVKALAAADVQSLQILLITDADMKQLGLSAALTAEIRKSISDPSTKLRAILAKSRTISRDTKWMRFDGSLPGVIPADQGKASKDLIVYDNAMAITETQNKPGLIQIGEIVKVGDVWKLVQIPGPIEGTNQTTVEPILMKPEFLDQTGGVNVANNVSPEMQKLLDKLRDHDEKAPGLGSTPTQIVTYNKVRADYLEQLVAISPADVKDQWVEQLADSLATAVRSGGYPDGLKRLEQVHESVKRSPASSTLRPYVTYRYLLASYSHQLQRSTAANRGKLQEWWLSQLEAFIKTYPKAVDTAEAELALAMELEFAGKADEAKKWYSQLVKDHPSTDAGVRGTGALRRLNLTGKTISLAGPGLTGGTIDLQRYRGKAVLVLFWGTWCTPCTEDLPQIQALYQKYRSQGFEVVGVNMDASTEPIQKYLRDHKVVWPQIYQPGGLDSPPAKNFGIILAPTMFLVDKTGKVVNNSINVEDLQKTLPGLLK